MKTHRRISIILTIFLLVALGTFVIRTLLLDIDSIERKGTSVLTGLFVFTIPFPWLIYTLSSWKEVSGMRKLGLLPPLIIFLALFTNGGILGIVTSISFIAIIIESVLFFREGNLS